MVDLAEWIGRTRSSRSKLDCWPGSAFHASTESPAQLPVGELPLLWHWFHFLETPRRSAQGDDGHPRKGDFLPPVDNPRRMFVGARSHCHQSLVAGTEAELVESILACETKQGSVGEMVLLTVGYEYSQAGNLCVEEQRDFMYLPARDTAAGEARTLEELEVPAAAWAWDVPTDEVLLFKFSALTFNGHRIHYDRDYAREQEAYPDLVVHGPLTALLLAELARAELGRPLVNFNFKARAPLYVGDRLRLRGGPGEEQNSFQLVAYRPDGQVAMTAEVR